MDVLTLPAAAENVVEVDPWGIVTLAGTFTTAGDALIPIVAPPLGPAEDKVTVQVEPADGDRVVGAHDRLLRDGVCKIVTVPPLTFVGMAAPVASADTPLVSVIDEEVSLVEFANVRATDATTLFGIDKVFKPQIRQVAVPVPLVQESVLFAAPEPAATVADVKSVVE